MSSPSEPVDLLVMTTLPDERDAVLHKDTGAFLDLDWQDKRTSRGKIYTEAILDDPKNFRVAVAMTRDQGTEPMAALTMHMLSALDPRCAVLIGICAGDGVDAQYCDVVVPDFVAKGYGGKRTEGKPDKPDGDRRRALRLFELDEIERFALKWSPEYARVWPRPTLPYYKNRRRLIEGFAQHEEGQPHPSSRRQDFEDYDTIF
jgi:hypothetical protein